MARVFLVDDERLIHDLLQPMITSLGYELAGEAFSGPDAMDLINELKPDIVLMDINMPGDFDGLKAGKMIQDNLNIPVVYISGDPADIAIKKVIRTGAYGFITKPFDKNQLDVVLQIALSRGKVENRLKRTIKKHQEEMEKEIIFRYVMNKVNHDLDPYENLYDLLSFISSMLKMDGIFLYKFSMPSQGWPVMRKIAAVENKKDYFPEKMALMYVSEEQLPMLKRTFMLRNFGFLTKDHQETIRKMGIKNLLVMPVFVDGNYFGLIGYYYNKRKPFGMELRNFLKTITETVSLVLKRHENLEHIRKMEEEKKINEKMLLRAEQLASLGQLTTAITHEIRQPLQSIKVLTDSVIFWDKENKKMNYADMLENFTKISSRVDRIDKIIKNMRLMAQAPDKIEIKTVNLNQSINETMEMFGQKLKNNRITLKLSLDPSVPSFLFSEVQLQQVLVNLMSNAVNALNQSKKDDKTIKIQTHFSKSGVTLTVADNGPGINDNNKNKIFQPFFTTQTKSEGTGMGLYIVSNILKYYNSQIEVTDNKGGGAVFKVTFKIPRV